MKIINLEKILKNNNVNIEFLNGMMIPDGINGSQGQRILNSMIDFGRQLLKLAAENANLSISSRGVETYFDNFYSGADNVEVNEQSILDTIKQVE